MESHLIEHSSEHLNKVVTANNVTVLRDSWISDKGMGELFRRWRNSMEGSQMLL